MTAIAPPGAVVVPAPPAPPDEPLFEIIDGQRVELPPMSAYAARIAFRLMSRLDEFARHHNLGEAVTEVLFHLALPVNRNRRPDGAFVSYDRWAKGRTMPERDNAWDVVPNLAVEVVSPTDPAEDLLEKTEEYFRSLVELVWIVYPVQRVIHVYESFTRIRVLTRNDELDGGTVLPGFRLPLTALFEEEPSTAA